jgi:hypothetical protein
MSHDKTRAAARQRMTQTGEPYTAARRAATSEHQAAGQDPPPGRGYALAMSGEIRDWLAGLRSQDPAAAARVGNALATLMEEGVGLGEPMVASTADDWPWALLEALDRSYAGRLERLTELRRGEAEAATLVRDLDRLLTELAVTWADLADDAGRGEVAAGRQQGATDAAGHLAAVRGQADEVRRLLARMNEARQRLGEQGRQLQARVEAFRVRKEVLKASYAAAIGSRRIHQAMTESGLAGPGGDLPLPETGAVMSAATARLADLTAELERAVGQQAWPAGLTELRPGGPQDRSFCFLFAAEPAGTALLLAVLEGAEAIAERYLEALLAAADLLRQVRAGQAPEAAAHSFADSRSFLAEFYPRGGGVAGGGLAGGAVAGGAVAGGGVADGGGPGAGES